MISVVIPAYNEEKNLPLCLRAFEKQQTNRKFEIIVVDNNSTDKTLEVARNFEKRLPLRVVTEKNKGRGAARHKGFEAAKGEIILSTDADTVVPRNWIERLTTELDKSNRIAVSGPCEIKDCSYTANQIFNMLQPIAMGVYKMIFGHYWLSGFNFGIYKNAYKNSGGFDIRLNALEDIDLSFRVSKLGKISYANTKVLFSGRRFQNGLVFGFLPYMKTFVQYLLFKKRDVTLTDIREV